MNLNIIPLSHVKLDCHLKSPYSLRLFDSLSLSNILLDILILPNFSVNSMNYNKGKGFITYILMLFVFEL